MKTKEWKRAQNTAKKALRERIEAIMDRVENGESIANVARDLGVSRQRVSQIVHRERGKANT